MLTECMMAAKLITINKAQCMCGHVGEEEAHEICNLYRQEVTKQGFKQCNHCSKAKAKQLVVEQNNQEHCSWTRRTLNFITISSMKHRPEKEKLLSRLYWMLMVIELMNFKILEFLNQKNELPGKACKVI
jgi:hypothetical protein